MVASLRALVNTPWVPYLALLLLSGVVLGCDRPTVAEVTDLLREHTNEDLTVLLHSPTCLAVSETRNEFRTASIAVLFQPHADITGCNAATNCTGYLHLSCSGGSWSLPSPSVPQSLELDVNAPVSMQEPRMDCGVCTYQGFLNPSFSDSYDDATHCYGKSRHCSLSELQTLIETT